MSLAAGGVQGIILAGGRSRRMGRDKAEVVLSGRTLLSWVIERLAPQCRALVISGPASGLDRRHGIAGFVADDLPGQSGPLAGIVAALDWIAQADRSVTHAVSCAVDTPFLPRDFVDRLCAARDGSGRPIACASSAGRRHPVAALWPVAIRAELRSALVDERLHKVGLFLDRHGATAASWPADPFDPFFNINTPADVDEAEAASWRLVV